MAKGFKHGTGGESFGGDELVIVNGTTRPAKATQNAIWVKTDAEITSYVISATQPSAPTEGMLWLSIADTGKVKMSAPVGKDWITVYPLMAKLCVSGSWMDVEVRSYQYGEWVEWFYYLYDKGKQYTDITGGWTSSGVSFAGTSVAAPTFSDTEIELDASNGQVVAMQTSNKVDCAKHAWLYVEFTNIAGDHNRALDFGLFSGRDMNSTIVAFATPTPEPLNVKRIEYLDIRNCNEQYYIGLLEGSGRHSIVHRVWLE